MDFALFPEQIKSTKKPQNTKHMSISAAMVKELREKTSAGMMDCKNALVEAGGEMGLAEEILRKKGIAKAGKKADRIANEGIISSALTDDGRIGALLEVSCETDFVAKNESFRNFVEKLTGHLLLTEVESEDVAGLLATECEGVLVDEMTKTKIAELGENIVVRRFSRYRAGEKGRLASYIHMQGRVGVMVEFSADSVEALQKEGVLETMKDVALHITASNPSCLSRDEVPADVVAKEREIYADQIKDKPANIVEKIVDGKIAKFFSQVCLLEQGFIKDGDVTIAELLKKAGDGLEIVRYRRYATGEA